MRKKRILFHSSFSKLKTGFGTNSRTVLTALYNTGKYDICEYAAGAVKWSDPLCESVPWKCYGALPDDNREISHIEDPGAIKDIAYGALNLDRVVKEFKPDVYIGAEDFWAFRGIWGKTWWNKITTCIWTTLDSLPLYPLAVDHASQIKNFWVWASFAEREMHRLGHKHVKTVHGCFDTSKFFPTTEEKKKELKKHFGIEGPVFGFVFRNQLRKLVISLLEGFKEFKRKDKTGAKLLLHTNYSEGWNIPAAIKELGIKNEDVLTTYLCRKCRQFEIKPFTGQGMDCKLCGGKKCQGNSSVVDALTQEQLNLVYNVMDGYVHPATSGGLEMPIVEAMLAGLPVATIPYSYGEEFTDNGFVFKLPYDEYRECASNFIKATPKISYIASFMENVTKKLKDRYKEYGREGRRWALKEFDIKRVVSVVEDLIDSSPFTEFDFNFEKPERNENYPLKDIQDDTEWLIDLYRNILWMDETSETEGVKHWLSKLKGGFTRQQVYEFFIKTAKNENNSSKKVSIRDFIKKTDKKKLSYVMPESLGDCVLSLDVLKSLRETYPDWEIYVATKPLNNSIFQPFPELVDGLIPYIKDMDSHSFWEGGGAERGLVDMAFLPHIQTQRLINYCRNGLDKNPLQRNTVLV